MKSYFYLIYITFVALSIYLSYNFFYQESKFFIPQDNTSNYKIVSGIIKDVKDTSLIVSVNQKDYEVKIDKNFYKDVQFIKGQKLSLVENKNNDVVEYGLINYYYVDGLLIIMLIFSLFVVLIAKFKGFKAIISVFISMILFYTIFINMVRIGYDPILASIIYVVLISIITVPLIHGFNKKSLSALIAIFIGYIIGYIISKVFLHISMVANIPYDEFKNLDIQFPGIDVYGIILSVIFIGITGALIDTVISIVSAVYEASKDIKLSFTQSFKLGIEVGMDVLASMTNTLLLAFLASSIPLIVTLSIFKGSSSIIEMINYDIIAFEITRIFISGMTLAIVIPISAIFVSYFSSKKY